MNSYTFSGNFELDVDKQDEEYEGEEGEETDLKNWRSIKKFF
jgi:hypothetical protein